MGGGRSSEAATQVVLDGRRALWGTGAISREIQLCCFWDHCCFLKAVPFRGTVCVCGDIPVGSSRAYLWAQFLSLTFLHVLASVARPSSDMAAWGYFLYFDLHTLNIQASNDTGTCPCPLHRGNSMVHDVLWWDPGWTYASPSAKTRGKQGAQLLQQKELVMVEYRYFHPLPQETIFIFVVNNFISSVVWSPMQPECRPMAPRAVVAILLFIQMPMRMQFLKHIWCAFSNCWCWGEILWNLSVFWSSGWWTPSA